jgi:hypothetical protein
MLGEGLVHKLIHIGIGDLFNLQGVQKPGQGVAHVQRRMRVEAAPQDRLMIKNQTRQFKASAKRADSGRQV